MHKKTTWVYIVENHRIFMSEEEKSQIGEANNADEAEKSTDKKLQNLVSDNKLKEYFENSNINFLIGSGLSCPYLSTLSNIEMLLSEVERKNDKYKDCVVASIYKKFFESVIYPACEIDRKSKAKIREYINVRLNYNKFIQTLYNLIQRRHHTYGISKTIHMFTTNVDEFLETELDNNAVVWNSGFTGLLNPTFDESNFSRLYSVTSRYYSRTSEIPVFNLIKIHGSINWKSEGKDTQKIVYDNKHEIVSNVHEKLSIISDDCFCQVDKETSVEALYRSAETISPSEEMYQPFLDEYEKLVIVNPTKKKFSTTVIDSHFYELMRIFSNTLEKPNSVLFVHGFSFADEHIAQLTMRAANTNPTLKVFVFAYQHKEISDINKRLGIMGAGPMNKNVEVISLPDVDLDFDNINTLYDIILKEVSGDERR